MGFPFLVDRWKTKFSLLERPMLSIGLPVLIQLKPQAPLFAMRCTMLACDMLII